MITALIWSKPFRCSVFPLVAALAAGAFALAEDRQPPRTAPVSSSFAGGVAPGKGNERLREGTKLIDVTGTFQAAGADNFSFLVNGNKESYRVLQNLALQRVSHSLEENRSLRQWVVSGTITEYGRANYLLLTKAVIQLPDDEAAGQ